MKEKKSNEKNASQQTTTGAINEALSNLAANTPLKYIVGGEEVYEPFRHRRVENPSNNWQTLANVIKSSFGAGILAMPQAFVYAGMFGGIVGTALLGLLTVYTTHLFIRATRYFCVLQKKPLMSYREGFKAACHFGPKCMRCMENCGDVLADIFLFSLQQGLLIVYSVFTGTTIKAIMDNFITVYPLRAYILICGIPLIFLACIRSLRIMAPISMFSNVLTLTAMLVIVIYSLVTEPLDSEMTVAGDFMKYPLAFGIVMFAMCNIGLMMSIENDMEHPEDLMKPLGIFHIGMTIVVAVYMIMGICGYYFCRAMCKGSVTENMPQNYIGIIVQLTVALSIFISFMLNNYVVVEIAWGHWIQPCLRRRGNYDENDKMRKPEYMFRIFDAIVTVLIAFAIPSLGDIISLIGAFCLSILGVFFPALAYMSYIHTKKIVTWWRCIIIILLIILAAFALATGTGSSLNNIIHTYFID